MAILPVVRYLIPCKRWFRDPLNDRRINIEGLLSNIEIRDQISSPKYFDISIFFALTEGFGAGECHVRCIHVDRETLVFATSSKQLMFSRDRLEVVAGGFPIKNCPFPWQG